MYPRGIIYQANITNYTLAGLFMIAIGEYIKNKRKLFKLTQVELAERSGVGIRFVRELEQGKATVQLNKVNQVLQLFGETLYPTKINEQG